jgi:hypothetical protein
MASTVQPPIWRRRLIQAALAVVMALVGAAFGAFAATLARGGAPRTGERDWGELALLIGAIPAAIFLAILAHELGHLLGGRLVGFRFALLIAGPLKVQRIGERLRFGLNRSLGLSGGLAACAPSTAETHNLARRMLVMVAGGPLTSLILGLLALAAVPLSAGFAEITLLLLGVVSLALAIATLIPLSTGGFQSDGRRILMLLRGGAEAERWCAAAAATFTAMASRPRAIDPALIAAATALPDGSLDDVGAHFLGYNAAIDRGDLAGATAHLAYVLAHREGYPAPLRPMLLLEGAYLAARRGDAQEARDLFDQARGGALIEPYTLSRVEAAVLLAEGQPEAATAKARAGLAAIERLRPGPPAELEADLLRASL